MSLYLEFEPHSWYKGYAIKDNRGQNLEAIDALDVWEAYTDNGMTYGVHTVFAKTLKELKQVIDEWGIK